MKTKKWWILAAIVGVCGAVLWAAKSQEGGVSKHFSDIAGQMRFASKGCDTLIGLDSIGVLIENLHPAALEAGLSPDQLQTDVELKLRLAGIKVLSKEEFRRLLLAPYLYVQVTAGKSSNFSVYAVSVNVDFKQMVFLVRDPNVVTMGATWRSGEVIIAGKDVITEGIRGCVRDLVDEFINDFLAANPKQQPAKNKEK